MINPDKKIDDRKPAPEPKRDPALHQAVGLLSEMEHSNALIAVAYIAVDANGTVHHRYTFANGVPGLPLTCLAAVTVLQAKLLDRIKTEN